MPLGCCGVPQARGARMRARRAALWMQVHRRLFCDLGGTPLDRGMTSSRRTTEWLASHALYLLPGVATARSYRPVWLRRDLVAGLVLTAFLVPQGMAYAELAGLPAVNGLYATLVPLLAYAIFGPSRILVLGPDSAIAPLIAAAVVPVAGTDFASRVELGGLLAVMVGVLLVIASFARLGFLTDLLSKPVRTGYLAGIAFVVIVQQVPRLLGYSVEAEDFLGKLGGLFHGLRAIDGPTAAIGLPCLTAILVLRRRAPQIPGVLVAVAGATLAFVLLHPAVKTLGQVPEGLPTLTLPHPHARDWVPLIASSLAIALLVFADTTVLSRSYASKLGERVDQSQELGALGAANLATSLFGGFPISVSSSRTPVAEAAGAQTQLTGVVAAVALGLVLVFGTGFLHIVPQAALAAVVIAAGIGLVDVPVFVRLRTISRPDFGLAIAAFTGVALLGVLRGVGIAIALSVFAVLERAWHPYHAVLGRVSGLKGYHDLARYPHGRQVPGLLLLRFDAPLFFANANVFRDCILKAVAAADAPLRRIVIAAEPMTDVDTTAADTLLEVHTDLARRGIDLSFAELKDPVKDKLARYGLLDRIGAARFYPTVGSAVHAYVDAYSVDWRDWEDGPGSTDTA